MARIHRVFIPATRFAEFFAPVREALLKRGVSPHMGKPLPLLDLASLACFDLRLAGSSWHTRTPYVFPLMTTSQDMSYPVEGGRPLE
jgi:hypothetical protein